MKKTISALFIAYLFLMMVGCKSKTVLVPVESVKTEWRDKYVRDSIYIKDSVRIYQRGDTVFQDRFLKIYKDRHVRDSIYINDTIRVPVLVPSEPVFVDKPDSWVDTTQKYICRVGLILLAIYILIRYRLKIFSFILKLIKF